MGIIMTDLVTRVAALEQGGAFQATQEAVRARDAEFLITLRAMKESMQKEQEGSKGSASSDEAAALKKENTRHQALLTKHEYRIGHLVAGMETMMSAKN